MPASKTLYDVNEQPNDIAGQAVSQALAAQVPDPSTYTLGRIKAADFNAERLIGRVPIVPKNKEFMEKKTVRTALVQDSFGNGHPYITAKDCFLMQGYGDRQAKEKSTEATLMANKIATTDKMPCGLPEILKLPANPDVSAPHKLYVTYMKIYV